MQLQVLNETGQAVGSVDFDEKVLGPKIRKRLMHQYIVMWEANQRLGTHQTKTKGTRKGSGHKMWKQKHTGRARCHYRRSPLWRKGGRIFGPHPRDYSYQMTRKAKREALKSALLAKLKDGEVIVLEGLNYTEPKTNRLAKTLKAAKVERTALLVTAQAQPNVVKSARNLPRVEFQPVRDINAYTILRANRVVFTQEAVGALQEFLKTGGAKTAAAKSEE
ncbi:MAG: 50S ribosomal protein L4 [Planctomycetota bacterium]